MVGAHVPVFFGLLLFGSPIFAALALAVAPAFYFWGGLDPVLVPMRMFSGMNNFSLMSILYPAMVKAGYDRAFSIGLITTAGTLGPIVPPSIALIIYGSVTGTSVGKLFAAGLLPALLIGGILIAYASWYSARKGYPRDALPTLAGILAALRQAAWGLGLPVILLMVVALLILTYVPMISMVLPNLLY